MADLSTDLYFAGGFCHPKQQLENEKVHPHGSGWRILARKRREMERQATFVVHIISQEPAGLDQADGYCFRR